MKTIMSFALALGLIFGVSGSSDAAFVLQVDDGVTLVTIYDNLAGDTSPAAGVISFSGAIGVWGVNVTTGISKPVLGNPSLAQLDVNSIDVSSGGAGTLDIFLSDAGFGPVGSTTLLHEVGGTTAGTVLADAWLDPTNAQPALPGTPAINFPPLTPGPLPAPTISQGPFGPGAFSGSVGPVGPIASGGLFSMYQKVNITHTAAGQVTSFNSVLEAPIPEPSSFLLLGLGLGTVGLIVRKRRG
jgi:hypothetical protein